MYAARGSAYRQTIFDGECKKFVQNTIDYANDSEKFIPNECRIDTLLSILVDWEHTALLTDNPNTELMDLVLDTIIVDTK